MSDMLPPHDIDSEQAALGSILIDPESFYDVSHVIEPNDFYVQANGYIYESIQALQMTNTPIDLITLATDLHSKKRLKDVGGDSYLISLINTVPTSVNALAYAEAVQETSRKRQLIQFAQQAAKLAYDGEVSANDSISQAGQLLMGIKSGDNEGNLLSAMPMSKQWLDELETRTPDKFQGLSTGYAALDYYLSGLKNGYSYILAGRPAMGKTSLALGSLCNTGVRNKTPSAFFSLEMTHAENMDRLVSELTGIPLDSLKYKRYTQSQYSQILDAVAQISESPLIVDTSTNLTPEQLRYKAIKYKREYGIQYMVIDHAHEMVGTGRGIREQNTHIAKSLKPLAKDLNIPLLTLAQCSRSCEERNNKRPLMSDLRETGAFEEGANVVAFVYRDEYYNPDTTERPNIGEIIFRKVRDGRTGTAELYWDAECSTFRTLQKQSLDLNSSSNFDDL